MTESILDSIKKLFGPYSDNTAFDQDLIIHINTVFMTLNQLGVGPAEGFRIKDNTTTWDEYILPEDDLEGVKTYIYLKVKLIFDPPAPSVINEYNKAIDELEWRLNVNAESSGANNKPKIEDGWCVLVARG